MNSISVLFKKLYFINMNLVLKIFYYETHKVKLEGKNVFIYFDYEREFSGHSVKLTDENIYDLLDLLNTLKISTTWFTVGKIFENYSNSVKLIIEKGHEIGSHTFFHKSPYFMSKESLKKDFDSFSKITKNICKVEGFHAPRNLWSFSIFKYLNKYDFLYDLSEEDKSSFNILSHRNHRIIRLKTLGDDWPFYIEKRSEQDFYNYLVNKVKKIQEGEVYGIGFHPWILLQDINYLNGFISFIKYIKTNEEFRINTALSYAKLINSGQEKRNNNYHFY